MSLLVLFRGGGAAAPAAPTGLIAELDPTAEASGTPLVLVDNTKTFLLRWDFPEPAEDPQWAPNRDADGDSLVSNRHRNREGQTLVLRIVGTGATPHTDLDTTLLNIEKKVQKIRREGGTLKCTLPSGKTYVLDLLAGSQAIVMDKRWVDNARVEVTLTFSAKPYWRGAAIQLADHVETTLPVLIFTETALKGSVPGLVKLVVDEDQAQAQRWLAVGFQSRYYDAAASAALFYECEGRTTLGGSAIAAGPTGASGAGSNVMRQTSLLTQPQAILSTQATAAGAHLSHVGDFRVFLRVQVPATNTGSVSVRLEWAAGDFGLTTLNDIKTIPDSLRGQWVLVDLGIVNLQPVVQGTQRWEGRVQAWSTVVGDDIDLDYFVLFPTSESYAEASAEYAYRPGTIVARDEFTGIAAGTVLNGRVSPLGGTWATSGVATDFTAADAPLSTDETMSRATTSEASPRFAILGATNYTDTEVAVDYYSTAVPGDAHYQGVIARWVDASNYVRLSHRGLPVGGAIDLLRLEVVVAGVVTGAWDMDTHQTSATWFRVRLVVYASGAGTADLIGSNGAIVETLRFSHASLATGGVLATGKPGIIDMNGAVTAATRYYDNFYAATPPPEPLVLAASRSLELRSNRAIRQDAAGAIWKDVSIGGFYPVAPPAWLEGRSLRIIVKASRGVPVVSADSGIDDLSARLTYTPLFTNFPE